MGESISPCLVLTDARYVENSTIKLFASRNRHNLPVEDSKYIAACIEHILSLPGNEIDSFMMHVQNLSVGPLRSGKSGICEEPELMFMLNKVFGDVGYDVLNGAT